MLSLIDEMVRFEDGDHTRLRYPSGAKAPYKKDSFPEARIVPVVQWQQGLDQIEREVLALNVQHYDETTCTLYDRLYREHEVNQERLRDLDPCPRGRVRGSPRETT